MSSEPCWYIYAPHWSIEAPDQDGQAMGPAFRLLALQATFLKKSTALSWELGEEDTLHLHAGAQLHALSVQRVSDPVEMRRHSGSPDHREVRLTEAGGRAALAADGLWLVYRAHWQRPASGDALVARQSTWMKRSCALSRDLPEHLKLPVSAGETLTLLAPPAGVSEAFRQEPFAVEHDEVLVCKREAARLRAAAPRPPLCRYFSPDGEELLRDIHACFQDGAFGPGCKMPLPEARASEAAPTVALLLPHGGYCNSGFVAAHGFRLLADQQAPVAIIVGNNHKSWHKFSLSRQRWSTPLGCVEPDLRLIGELEEAGYPLNRAAHADEHSVENQLPFLQTVHPGTRIAPIGVGAVDLAEADALAETLAAMAARHGALLLGTTDFSHEGPSYGGPALPMDEITSLTREKDMPLLDAVLRMDATDLLRLGRGSSMCGAGAAAVLILTCRKLGLTSAELLRYLVNTEVTPCGSTTGFASFAFRRPAG